MKTAVIYARYSSDSQSEQSIEGQLRVCEEYAQRNNFVVLNTYIDRAMTGTNDNRPDFQKMIKDSENKTFEFLIVYKLDRFSRNKYETAKNKKALEDNGVKFLSAMENIPDTPEGIILESLLEGMAEYYSAELAQKVKRGMNETRLKGNFTGGNILFGYSTQNHKVIINEEQSAIVRFVYEQYARDVFVKDIISALTEKGCYNKGKPFATNTIYNILRNEKYSGIYRFKDQIFENMYPAIVPTEIYENVRQKTNINKYGKRSIEVVYMLRNKLKCGYCGKPISAECGTTSQGKKRHYYKCLGRKRNNGCNKTTIRKEILEDFIVNVIIKQLSKPQIFSHIVNQIYKLQEEQSSHTSLFASLNKDYKQTKQTLNNILKAIEQGVVNSTTNKRMKELENKLQDIEKQLFIEKSKTNIKVSIEDIKTYLKDALKQEPQLLINYLIKEIILFDKKAEFYFNTPIMQNHSNTLIHSSVEQMPKYTQNVVEPEMLDINLEMYV